MTMIHISDARIQAERDVDGPDVVTLWRVRGLLHEYLPTKLAAEVAARLLYPNEDPDTRYGRISFVRFVQEER